MNDESNLEYLGKTNPQKLTSLAEDIKKDQEEIRADMDHWKKHGVNRSTKAAKSKCEMMEEMTRERFPWEE